MTARALIIAAPNSGAGKTTVTLGLLAALKRRGIAVKAAKAGPDYIDSAFHAAATGTQGFNLDTWAMPPSLVDALVAESACDCQLLVIEGVMGLFDGVPGPSGGTGAAADLAARFAVPVIMVLDVRAQAQSAAHEPLRDIGEISHRHVEHDRLPGSRERSPIESLVVRAVARGKDQRSVHAAKRRRDGGRG